MTHTGSAEVAQVCVRVSACMQKAGVSLVICRIIYHRAAQDMQEDPHWSRTSDVTHPGPVLTLRFHHAELLLARVCSVQPQTTILFFVRKYCMSDVLNNSALLYQLGVNLNRHNIACLICCLHHSYSTVVRNMWFFCYSVVVVFIWNQVFSFKC